VRERGCGGRVTDRRERRGVGGRKREERRESEREREREAERA